MARVSLKEAYDNKDVVAQIYAIRDIAEGASDTADSAVTTANDAKTYVDTLGPQVEGAVQTANEASASAQTSAETVAGYDARLTEVEGDLNQAESDIDGLETGLNAVTLRVTTAEGNIVTIQGRVTALETADGQNVKLTGEHAIGNYAVLLTGNQEKIGNLSVKGYLRTDVPNFGNLIIANTTDDNSDNNKNDRHAYLIFADYQGNPIARIGYTHTQGTRDMKLRFYKADGTWFPDIVLGQVTE